MNCNNAACINKQIANNLLKLRMKRGLTQTELAKAAKVSYQQLQKYESGVNRMTGARFVQFAHALDIEVSAFFEGVCYVLFD